MFLEVLASRFSVFFFFYKLIFKFWFYVLFYSMFVHFGFITGLQ